VARHVRKGELIRECFKIHRIQCDALPGEVGI